MEKVGWSQAWKSQAEKWPYSILLQTETYSFFMPLHLKLFLYRIVPKHMRKDTGIWITQRTGFSVRWKYPVIQSCMILWWQTSQSEILKYLLMCYFGKCSWLSSKHWWHVALFEWILRLTDNVMLMMPIKLSQPTHPTTQMCCTFVSDNAVWHASKALQGIYSLLAF